MGNERGSGGAQTGAVETETSARKKMRRAFSVVCPAPWFSLLAYPDGTYAPCCFTPHRGKDLGSFSNLESLWNSDYWRRMRQLITQGKYSEAGCPSTCFYLAGKDTPPYDSQWIVSSIGDRFLETPQFERVMADFSCRAEVVESSPALLQTFLTYHCNLRCVMCPQDHYDKNRMGKKELSLLLENPGSLCVWIAVGGEVLTDRKFVDFYASLDLGEIKHLSPVIFTNGALLDEKTLAAITTGSFPKLVFSIDGATAETYNRVRVRSDFETVMDNMERAVRHYRENGVTGNIIWHLVVMKSTLGELELAISKAGKLGVQFEVEMVTGDFPDENIFEYPHAIEDIGPLKKAIAALSGLPINPNGTSQRITYILPSLKKVLACNETVTCFQQKALADRMVEILRLDVVEELLYAAGQSPKRDAILAVIADTMLGVPEIQASLRPHLLMIAALMPERLKNEPFHVAMRRLLHMDSDPGLYLKLLDLATALVDRTKLRSCSKTKSLIATLDHLLGSFMMNDRPGNGKMTNIFHDEPLCSSFLSITKDMPQSASLFDFLQYFADSPSIDANILCPSAGLLLYRLASWRETSDETNGATEKARRLFEDLLRIEDLDRPLRAGCHYHLAKLASAKADRTSAREHLRRCLELDPDHGAAARLAKDISGLGMGV